MRVPTNGLLTDYQDGKLRVEYFGKRNPAWDAEIEAAVGQRAITAGATAELGRFAEERQFLAFEVTEAESREIQERIREIKLP